ncbi:unnamed protein product [Protopolystoma xenopodis]|uniref:Uncharacterized protein n=1 Tax=Protopolystoma xenopodis TaxID=117903 RepID=A0A448WYZ8_9PLAT|nr:unnamed protein product [Protopolystoma xenopodis]
MARQPVSIWCAAAVSMGVLLGLSCVGMALVLEAEIYSPALAALRTNSWILDFEMRCYRPLRGLMLGLFRR